MKNMVRPAKETQVVLVKRPNDLWGVVRKTARSLELSKDFVC